MSEEIEVLLATVRDSLNRLMMTDQFSQQILTQPLTDGGIIVINNSFLSRKDTKTATVKSEKYLAVPVIDKKPNLDDIKVVIGESIQNTDFKYISPSESSKYQQSPLSLAIQEEIDTIGELVFILIGELTAETEDQELSSSIKVILRPKSAPDITYDSVQNIYSIFIEKLDPPEEVWSEIELLFQSNFKKDKSSLKQLFLDTLTKMKSKAIYRLAYPKESSQRSSLTFLSSVSGSYRNIFNTYEKIIRDCKIQVKDFDDEVYEILRLSYCFSEEALRIIEMIVGISDIKPLVLWCTLYEQYMINKTFQIILGQEGKKANLQSYKDQISNARNHAFHNLTDISFTIHADLAGVPIKAKKFIFYVEHSNTTNRERAKFLFEDKEMIDILSGLTRTKEKKLPFEFWEQNANVMQATVELIESTEQALWAIRSIVVVK